MPVDFVDRLEEQLREAAAVPAGVRRRRRVVAAARPAATVAATVALAAGAVGAVAAAAGDEGAGSAAGTASGTAAGGASGGTVASRPPVTTPPPTVEAPPALPVPSSSTVPGPPSRTLREPAPPPPSTPAPPSRTLREPAPAPPTSRAPAPSPARPVPAPAPDATTPVPGPAVPAVPAPRPARPPGATTPAAPTAPAPERVVPAQPPSVRVLNGTTATGLARNASRLIAALGYRVLAWGNAADNAVQRTFIETSPSTVTAARGLAASLGVPQSDVRILAPGEARARGAGIAVTLGPGPSLPKRHTSLALRGPRAARGVATWVTRADGTVALSLRTSRLARGGSYAAWVPGGGGWTRLRGLPLTAASTQPIVVAPIGRRVPTAFLLTAEDPGAQPARPGRVVLSSRG